MSKIHLKVWRDIVAQKWQFLALALIILLGVTSYGGMMGMIDDVLQSIEETMSTLRFHDLAVTLEGAQPERVVGQVAALDGVQAVSGRLVMDTGLAVDDDTEVHARLIGVPAGAEPAVDRLYIQRGRGLEAGDGAVAVLDHHFADHYGYGPGTVLHPIVDGQRLDVTVVGVAVSPEYLMAVASAENPLPSPGGFAVLFMPRQEVQRLAGAEGAVNELSVRTSDRSPAAIEQTMARVRAALGEGSVRSLARGSDNPSYSLLKLDLEGGREMMAMVPTMFLVVAAMSIYVFLNRMVQAQRPQIGVLKALGYGRRAIMGHYLLFSAAVALAGSLAGFALSYPLGVAMSHAYAGEFGLPFVVARFHLAAAALATAITLLVCLLAALLPAWRSAGTAPARALRFDPSAALTAGSVPLAERLLGRVVPLGTGAKIALRNLFRNRRRTLTTAAGFVFAFVVLLACWALFDGLNYMLDIQFRQADRWDVQALFAAPQGEALLEDVRGWPGVRAAEEVIALPVTVEAGGEREDALLTGMRPESTLHHLQLPRGTAAADVLAPGHALLTPQQASQLGVQSGDQVTLRTPLGAQVVTVDTTNGEVMGNSVYVGLDWLRSQLGGSPTLNGLLLRVDPGQQKAVRARLYRLGGIASVELKSEIVGGWQSLMGLYYVMMGVFLAFALVIAGAVIFNTMTVNVLERQREVATMRALGQSRGRLAWMITLENLLVGLLALVPGLAAGTVTTYYLFQVFGAAEADLYMPFHISPSSYVCVTALIAGTALVAQIPAVRRVNRLDLAAATKVMT